MNAFLPDSDTPTPTRVKNEFQSSSILGQWRLVVAEAVFPASVDKKLLVGLYCKCCS